MVHLACPKMSKIESPASDLLVWSPVNYQHKKTTLLGEGYLNCFGRVLQEKIKPQACFFVFLSMTTHI